MFLSGLFSLRSTFLPPVAAFLFSFLPLKNSSTYTHLCCNGLDDIINTMYTKYALSQQPFFLSLAMSVQAGQEILPAHTVCYIIDGKSWIKGTPELEVISGCPATNVFSKVFKD